MYNKTIQQYDKGRIKVCPCAIYKCYRKCCKPKEVYSVDVNVCLGVRDLRLFYNETLDLYSENSLKTIEKTLGITPIYGFERLLQKCEPKGRLISTTLFRGHVNLSSEGNLLVTACNGTRTYNVDEYCFDTFLSFDLINQNFELYDGAYFCSHKSDSEQYNTTEDCEQHIEVKILTQNYTGIFVSSGFILLTIILQLLLPEATNNKLYRYNMLAHLISMLNVSICIAVTRLIVSFEITTDYTVRVTISTIIYFEFLATFFWLNVMCFDVWKTLSFYHELARTRDFAYLDLAVFWLSMILGIALHSISNCGRRGKVLPGDVPHTFYKYCAYAFGFSTGLTLLFLLLEIIPSGNSILPRMRKQESFLNGITKDIYLKIPIGVICFINAILVITTVISITINTRKNSQILKATDNTVHSKKICVIKSKSQPHLFYWVNGRVMGPSLVAAVVKSPHRPRVRARSVAVGCALIDIQILLVRNSPLLPATTSHLSPQRHSRTLRAYTKLFAVTCLSMFSVSWYLEIISDMFPENLVLLEVHYVFDYISGLLTLICVSANRNTLRAFKTRFCNNIRSVSRPTLDTDLSTSPRNLQQSTLEKECTLKIENCVMKTKQFDEEMVTRL